MRKVRPLLLRTDFSFLYDKNRWEIKMGKREFRSAIPIDHLAHDRLRYPSLWSEGQRAI